MYTKVKVSETDEDEIAVDASGYTGNFHRVNNDKNLKPYSFEELAKLLH
jgi:hypothetical protein